MPTVTPPGCTCANTARCRACTTTITAAVGREAGPPAQRTTIGTVLRRAA
jgi:hypothetical protein